MAKRISKTEQDIIELKPTIGDLQGQMKDVLERLHLLEYRTEEEPEGTILGSLVSLS
mgnify:CR=1 FL=1